MENVVKYLERAKPMKFAGHNQKMIFLTTDMRDLILKGLTTPLPQEVNGKIERLERFFQGAILMDDKIRFEYLQDLNVIHQALRLQQDKLVKIEEIINTTVDWFDAIRKIKTILGGDI